MARGGFRPEETPIVSIAHHLIGVTFNLTECLLEIKSDRRDELMEEITCILKADSLEPGQAAGKLKGKLMFGASQLWGKVGRAFLRAISERQYARVAVNDRFVLDPPLRESLNQWLALVEAGHPRTIDLCAGEKADAVLFTDGFSPDPRDHDRRPDRIGAVLFDRRLRDPLQFSEAVPQAVKDQWLARQTQIVPVEMVAPIVALKTFESRLFRADLLMFTDSEVVEAAFVKAIFDQRRSLSPRFGLLGFRVPNADQSFHRSRRHRRKPGGCTLKKRS